MLRAGFGVAPITPTPPVYLAGFGARTQPVTEVHEDLEARALYLDGDDGGYCLVVCDLLGMSAGYSRPVREAMATALGTPIDRVLVACTHTHSGPSAIAGTEAIGWPNPDGYADVLRDGCVNAATSAKDQASEASLRFASAALPDGFAFNRRGLPYEEPWFSVLDVRRDDGRLGVLANLHIHPVLLGPEWMAVATDWVGPFRTALEEAVGGTAIQLTGSLGDINPTPPQGTPDDTYAPWASAEQTIGYGRKLADVVAGALDGAQPVEDRLNVVRSQTLEVPVGGTAIAALHGEPTMLVELIEWALGNVRLVSIPGEAFHLLGREIAASRSGRVLLAGIAPSWNGYLPHPWGDGYEEGVSYGQDAVRAIREALTVAP